MACLAILAASALALILGSAAYAGRYEASADVESTITLSGNWTSVQWHESYGCYRGAFR
jgi:hypothetical protein